ncbi:GTP cyclohydrolase 1 domain protein [Natronomonas pharaonis DSM 2160]|uniref:GTP cyclohydrolase 1 domain protein n=1 Tax=Natronomonas pharaonis (strain ATCC 35678 / DSM 2160 / CIP 103997 / JCM 8858 / NBRC 14720 / NCIMB 2260 / Gabara) TaxID=348780 RepID=Q3IN37_NATPD|nr:Nif3-like dinuclear metal center hexameric protein [Natronomonas pharaonis]CAI50469.1 GTP cyclohydrolase 1 domain protein [Natronomonas pharaonis DSM 2160]
MQLETLCSRLDDRLNHDDYADVDASANGLQVGDDDRTVERVAVAVDGVEATVDAAAEAGADLLVVHHGFVWGGLDRVTGREYDRIAACIENDVPLYVSHLPLDGHPELGNAAGLAEFLDCTVTEPFGDYGGVTIGQQAQAETPYTVATLRERLGDLDTGGQPVQVLDFGPETIEDIAIVTGSGTDWIREAEAAGVDALVTGEGKQKAYHEAREAGISVFLAGHYATETFGVRRIAEPIEEWGLETTFLDHPTGL